MSKPEDFFAEVEQEITTKKNGKKVVKEESKEEIKKEEVKEDVNPINISLEKRTAYVLTTEDGKEYYFTDKEYKRPKRAASVAYRELKSGSGIEMSVLLENMKKKYGK